MKVRKALLLVPVLVLAPLLFAGDHALTQVTPASSTTSSDSVTNLPVLRHRDFGASTVPTPATPATPASAVAQPAKPATPALPPGTTVAPPSASSDDPCDGFDNIDARSRCRENQQQRSERDFERSHNSPTPFPTHRP